MKITHDLGELEWVLAGWTPYVWRQQRSIESGVSLNAEITGIPALVPGSVQSALRAAGELPDWNVGVDARCCEWVENRHWIYTTQLPDGWVEPGCSLRLLALGLDYDGWFLLNGREIGAFRGSFMPYTVDLTPYLRESGNSLQIVFGCPPRWLGQIGYTSQMVEWKTRFNYFWDWTSRLVQIGIWDALLLEVTNGEEILTLDVRTGARLRDLTGFLRLKGTIGGTATDHVRIELGRDGEVIHSQAVSVPEFVDGLYIEGLPVELWWPNGAGTQPLYELFCCLIDQAGCVLDERKRTVGFKSLTWAQCDEAPPGADPWLCSLNGRPVFLQGVNWTPIRPNYADVTDDQYEDRLASYVDLGCNMLRVWGGAFLEKRVFYDLCDRLGLLVWQEFPLSSSGLDNDPPRDPEAIDQLAGIAGSYIERRAHHVCLAIWSGGNELQADGVPVDITHPMIARLSEVVGNGDPDRRFLPTSPSGPRFSAREEEFGQGVHWDVHGPWNVVGELSEQWTRYWKNADALFYSEIGAPGASGVEVIRRYRGDLPEMPAARENPLWRRTGWWIEWDRFIAECGREPDSLEEYVSWSQTRQSTALAIAARSARDRFPRCGGFLVWMGHDSFPCTANTSILDFHGQPKPAAYALRAIFRDEEREGAPV